MYYLNEGGFEIKKEYEEKIIELLVNNGVINDKSMVDITHDITDGSISVELSSKCYGDIEAGLKELTADCLKAGIAVDGFITYSGDYRGVYEIVNGDFHSYDEKTYAVKEALTEKNIISPDLKNELYLKICGALDDLPVIQENEKINRTLKEILNRIDHTQESDFLPALSPVQCKDAWEEIIKIYDETRSCNDPKYTMRKIIEKLGFSVTKEVFAVVTVIKKNDGRITPQNRGYLANVRYNPDCIKLDSENVMLKTNLDHIHSSHINNLITEMRN